MTFIDNTNQSFTLSDSSETSAGQTVSNSDIGNLFAVTPSQILSICPESAKPRLVILSNVGSIALTVSDNQRPFPFGMRLPGGSVKEIVTSHAIYCAAPPIVNSFGAGLVPTTAYVSVSIAS